MIARIIFVWRDAGTPGAPSQLMVRRLSVQATAIRRGLAVTALPGTARHPQRYPRRSSARSVARPSSGRRVTEIIRTSWRRYAQRFTRRRDVRRWWPVARPVGGDHRVVDVVDHGRMSTLSAGPASRWPA